MVVYDVYIPSSNDHEQQTRPIIRPKTRIGVRVKKWIEKKGSLISSLLFEDHPWNSKDTNRIQSCSSERLSV